MNKYQQIAEKIVVTFFEGALVYFTVVPHPQIDRTLIAGAVGAGLSAVYNVLRQSTPTISQTTITTPEPPMNGVVQLTTQAPVVTPDTPAELPQQQNEQITTGEQS